MDRQYELVYILPPDTTEQQVTELHGQLEAVVSRLQGTFEKTENWGRKRLAYEIGHHKEGVYVLEVINGSGELMKELDRRLRVMDQVIRHLVVRVGQKALTAMPTAHMVAVPSTATSLALSPVPELVPNETWSPAARW